VQSKPKQDIDFPSTNRAALPVLPAPRWIAYHEAGHAIARLALDETEPFPGPVIRRALIRRRSEWGQPLQLERGGVDSSGIAGIVEKDPRAWLYLSGMMSSDPRYRHAAGLDAIEAVAGPVAEAKARHLSSGAGYLGFVLGTSNDLEQVRAKLAIAAGITADEVRFSDTWGAATHLLRRHWRAVKAVAEALVLQMELQGDEIERLVLGAMPEAFPRLLAARSWQGAS
jgi:hypothetical protein